MKIFERFGDKSFHTSIVTTFGIDFDTYEHIALSRLRGSGCRNNILLTDARMLTYALDGASLLPSLAGSHYTVSGISSRSVFHPKIVFQLGRQTGRLIVGSANMTASGIAGNLELAGAVSYTPGDDGGRQLISAAWHYVNRLIDPSQEAITYQLDWARHRTPWLMDAAQATREVITLADGNPAAFLVNDGTIRIGDKFVDLVQDHPVNRLIIISPYWDEELVALKSLISRLDVREVVILIDKDRHLFPRDALRNLPNLKVLDIGAFNIASDRFVHAKLMIAQTAYFDHVLYGSANCTVAALGGTDFGGLNEEACLYRRFVLNSVLPSLGLDEFISDAPSLSTEILPQFIKSEEIPLEESSRRFPGRFESVFDTLRWWRPTTLATETCRVELLGPSGGVLPASLSSLPSGSDGHLRFRIAGLQERPSFARLRFSNEDVSAPAVITLIDSLWDNIREARGNKAESAAMQLSEETEEGFWLLEVLDTLEKAEAEQTKEEKTLIRSPRDNVRGSDKKSSFKTLDYEHFMAGRRLKSEVSGFSGHGLVGSDLSLVRGFLNRILSLSVGDVTTTHESAVEENIAESLFFMGDETDNDENSIENGADFSNKPTGLIEKKRQEEEKRKTVARIVATRKQITEAVSRFNKRIQEKAKTQNLSLIDVLRLRAILMIVAASGKCGFDSLTTNTNKFNRTPLQVLPTYGNDSWPRLLGQLLYTFFGSSKPAVLCLHIESVHDQIPLDVLECWATCFWAANVCQLTATNHHKVNPSLQRFTKLTNDVYLLTALRPEELRAGSVQNVIAALNKRFSLRLGFSSEALNTEHVRRCQEKK
jgi:hypothetical protein